MKNANLSRIILNLLAVLLVFVLVNPEPAQARRYLSDGGGGQSGEGDPLDANDYGTGGGGLIGDDVEDSFGLIESGGGGLLIQLPSSDASLVLILDFRGKIPVLQVLKISSREVPVEETHAR